MYMYIRSMQKKKKKSETHTILKNSRFRNINPVIRLYSGNHPYHNNKHYLMGAFPPEAL
jgi:hypothetical protein